MTLKSLSMTFLNKASFNILFYLIEILLVKVVTFTHKHQLTVCLHSSLMRSIMKRPNKVSLWDKKRDTGQDKETESEQN